MRVLKMAREKQLLIYNGITIRQNALSQQNFCRAAESELIHSKHQIFFFFLNPANQEYYTKQSYHLKNERDIVAQMSKN